MLRVVVMLVLWVCGFVAFLVAPILALAVAWVLGMAWVAVRQRGGRGRSAAKVDAIAQVASSHQFGAAFPGRTDTATDGKPA